MCMLMFQRFIQFLASNNVAFVLDNFNDNASPIGQWLSDVHSVFSGRA